MITKEFYWRIPPQLSIYSEGIIKPVSEIPNYDLETDINNPDAVLIGPLRQSNFDIAFRYIRNKNNMGVPLFRLMTVGSSFGAAGPIPEWKLVLKDVLHIPLNTYKNYVLGYISWIKHPEHGEGVILIDRSPNGDENNDKLLYVLQNISI